MNDVYIGDNTVIENCIVESRDTIRANTTHIGAPDNVKIVIEENELSLYRDGTRGKSGPEPGSTEEGLCYADYRRESQTD